MLMPKLHHVLINPGVSRDTSVAEVIVSGRHIAALMNENKDLWFPAPTPTLEIVSKNLDALEAAEVTARTKAKGAAAARDTVLAIVHRDLDGLRHYVQSISDQNPGREAEIAGAAGMLTRKEGKHEKPTLAITMTKTPGEVLLRAKAVNGASYEWQYSLDGGKTWVTAGHSTVADLTIPDLTVGAIYWFRLRTTLGHTTNDWSQVVSFMVH
jgi:hypothetical protein